jgi:hypothetical protein
VQLYLPQQAQADADYKQKKAEAKDAVRDACDEMYWRLVFDVILPPHLPLAWQNVMLHHFAVSCRLYQDVHAQHLTFFFVFVECFGTSMPAGPEGMRR